jgi:DnaK suppressor protein
MNHEQMQHFGTVLRTHLQQAVPEIQGMLTNRKESDAHREPMDEVDLACAAYRRDLMVKIKHRNYRLIDEIQSALRRIELGIYGICLECGQDIGLKRLRARPMTAVCIDCKRELERA